MANNPDDAKPQSRTASDGAAVKFDAALQARTDVSAPAKSHPKLHKSEEEGPIQDTSGEPIVEDEP